MGDKFSLIAFEEAGGLAHLYDEAQCAAAVADGRICRDTRMTVYQSGKPTAMEAREYPLFAALFAAADEAAAPAVDGSALPDGTPGDSVDDDAFDGDESAPVAMLEEAYPPAEDAKPAPTARSDLIGAAAPASAAGPAAPDPSFRALRNLIVGLILAFLVGWCVSRQDSPSTNPPLPEPATNISENVAAPAVDPEADIPTQTLYALREVLAREDPGSAGEGVKIPRGTALTGIIVSGSTDAGESWLKVKIGPHSGRYVWTSNLGASSPPPLDSSFAGEKTVYVAATVRTEPRDDAPPIAGDAEISPGATLAVAGIANSDWAEILLRRAGVGYVPASVFEKPAEESAAAGTSDVHEILLSNRCSDRDFDIALYYRTSDGWQANNGEVWSYHDGESSYPTYDGRRLQAISDTIYYAVTAINGKNYDFKGDTPIYYGNRRIYMRRAKIDVKANGDYEIAMGC